ncbi:protein of unknown function (plasmid) [Pararobbsia alpina]
MVDPTDLVVMVVGWLVAVWRASDLVTGLDHCWRRIRLRYVTIGSPKQRMRRGLLWAHYATKSVNRR